MFLILKHFNIKIIKSLKIKNILTKFTQNMREVTINGLQIKSVHIASRFDHYLRIRMKNIFTKWKYF